MTNTTENLYRSGMRNLWFWTWLPLPLFVAGTVILALLDIRTVYEPPWLIPIVNTIIFIGAALISVILASRVYLEGGSRVVLALGCSMLTLGLAFLAGGWLVGEGNLNGGVASYNILSLLSGIGMLVAGLLASLGRGIPRPQSLRPWLMAGSYVICLVPAVIVTIFAILGRMPSFVTVEGTTELRTVVLTATVMEYLFAAVLFALLNRYLHLGFLRWYWLGLGLVAIGICGVALAVVGSPLGWTGRIAQALGQVYIVVGLISLVRRSQKTSSIVALKQAFDSLKTNLRESEERYFQVVQNTTAIILRVDLEARITFANDRALEFFGYSRKELIGQKALGTIVPEYETTGRNLAEMVDQIAENPDAFHSNVNENMCSDGKRVWIEWTNSGIYDSDGNLEEFLSVGIDITKRKEMEEALREIEAHKVDFYRSTLQAATGGKLVVVEREEIDRLIGSAEVEWTLNSTNQLRTVRNNVAEMARTAGMKEEGIQKLLTCVGEATTNILKHAKEGTVSTHKRDGLFFVKLHDNGPGIDALNLPDVALTMGYSTANTGGMGYKFIIMSADRVYLATGSDGTTLVVELSLNPDGTQDLHPITRRIRKSLVT